MKKLLSLGLVLFLSFFALVACGEEGQTPSDVNGGDEISFEGADILLWIDREYFALPLIAALEERFPGVSFDWHEMGNVDSLTNLSLDGPAGLGADIVFFPHDHIERAVNENLVLPLGPDIANMMHGRLIESAIGSVIHNNNYYGIPLTTESVALFYNRTLLNELGFEVATSFEELFEQAEAFNNVSANDFILRWQAGDAFRTHFALTAHGFELFGPNHNDGDLVNFYTPEVIAGLQWLETLRDAVLPVPTTDLDDANTSGAFIDGEVPYLITGPWEIAGILEDGNFDLGITTIPTINGVQPITFSGNVIAAGSAFTEHAALVREILKFLMSDEGMTIMYADRGWIPALIDSSGIAGLAENPYHAGILAQANYSHPMPIIPEMSFFWGQAPGMISAVWDGILTPEEAARRAYEGFNSARELADQ